MFRFKTEGVIADDYEVLPMMELELNSFVKKKEVFEEVFELFEALKIELLQEDIISVVR